MGGCFSSSCNSKHNRRINNSANQATASSRNSYASHISETSHLPPGTQCNYDISSSVLTTSRQPAPYQYSYASPASANYKQPSKTEKNSASSVSATSRQPSATVNNSANSVSATSRQASISQYNYAQPVLKNPNINITRIQQTEPKRLVDVISPTEKIEENLVPLSGIKRQQVQDLILQYMSIVKIDDIYEVKNQFLKGMYELKKEEYKSRYQSSPKEKTLIHATARSNVNNIIKNNFDWRKVIRKKYGAGASFTHDADYANCHCNRRNGPQRAFIITKVLIYNTHIGNDCTDLLIPPENVDTTVGKRNRQELVYVKYNDNEFLPIYVAYYESSNDMISSSPYYENNSNYRQRRTTYNY